MLANDPTQCHLKTLVGKAGAGKKITASQNTNHDCLGRIINDFSPTVILCNFPNVCNNMS